MYEPGELLTVSVNLNEECYLDFLDYNRAVEGIREYVEFADGTTVLFLGFEDFTFRQRNHYWGGRIPLDLRIAKFLIGEKVCFWGMDKDRETQLRIHLSRLQEDAQPQVQSS